MDTTPSIDMKQALETSLSRHYCGKCKKWFKASGSFSDHTQEVHGLDVGIYPLGSITPKIIAE